MTIEVAGGTAAIAGAEVTSGPCSHLLVHSATEAGATMGYAAAQITYNGPSDIPPLCLVKLTSLDGETIVATTSVTATSDPQPCCPVGSCCAQTSAISLHHHVVFDQPVLTISFPGAIDGGLGGGAADTIRDVPQAMESGSVDLAEDTPNAPVDASDQNALDGGTTVDASLGI